MADGIRAATRGDADAVLALATAFATSFSVDVTAFGWSFAAVLDDPDACLLVAESRDQVVGYVLGFVHVTFYANGPVAWVEEITVREADRRGGVGRRLMAAFETWATDRDARLVALATRRATAFYEALGYQASATYFRRLSDQGPTQVTPTEGRSPPGRP